MDGRNYSLPWFLCLALIFLPIRSVLAQQQDQPYPTTQAADSCGGGPGDPPIFTFAPGSAKPMLDSPTEAHRLRRWREIIRPDIRLVLLTGVADTGEPGYTPDLGLRRARAVRDVLAGLHVDPAGIWVRGESVSPATPFEREAVFARNVTIGDPLRVIACNRSLLEARFRWFTSHCSGQAVDASVQKTCDMATVQLGGDDPPSQGALTDGR